MATRKQFLQRANELNIVVDDNGEVITIDAPQGKVFATFFTHYEIVIYETWRMADVYDHFIDLMKMGIVDCEERECETCNPIIA